MLSPLFTDFYELTMAYGYWKSGKADQEAAFHLFFRKMPFGGGYVVAAGLADAVAYLRDFRFASEELAYLASLTGSDGRPLFEQRFLEYLADLRLACDVDAVPEGTVVFAHEPLVRVCGSLLQAQLLESALLNVINFQTLIATKAARICRAAGEDLVIEFGMRRAQGPDGAMSATRAAFVGGCGATSNALAGMRYGIPVRGTHAHSWVLSFDTQREAFETYAQALPDSCVFLVDTYDSLHGVRDAIAMGRQLAERGHRLAGIRLDSGDLAWLSIEARKMLDAAGFRDAFIVASNELDEHVIESLKQQGASITVWGVGGRLVTGGNEPALGGIYKLTAVRDTHGTWQPKVKLSEDSIKANNPGILQVRRFEEEDGFVADMIFDETHPVPEKASLVDPADATRRRTVHAGEKYEDLLKPVFRGGRFVGDTPSLLEIQQRGKVQLARLHRGIKRLQNPHRYPVGLERGLHERKLRIIEQTKDDIRKGR